MFQRAHLKHRHDDDDAMRNKTKLNSSNSKLTVKLENESVDSIQKKKLCQNTVNCHMDRDRIKIWSRHLYLRHFNMYLYACAHKNESVIEIIYFQKLWPIMIGIKRELNFFHPLCSQLVNFQS